MKTRTEIIALILETFASQAGGQPVLGYKYIIGRTDKNEAIALIYDPEDRNDLTSELLEEIKAEATQAGLAKPIQIFAMQNGGPNGSPSYCFHQLNEGIVGKFEELAKVPAHNENKMLSCIEAAVKAAALNACDYVVTQRKDRGLYEGIYEVNPLQKYVGGWDLCNREYVVGTNRGQPPCKTGGATAYR